ncbi:bestrophin-like domain [Mycobacterium deserti]|uniref:DUF4239 domain-containing protein n=1 Tax=Mycobacterium deserti TaxID=2978347 RepID=A0ABT2ML03_9MYCO|nr:DUF4239 domain-containing protein [Mycobacterium deserti]MCT7662080.1 DUF4239 domain-containing protein [Mycobacterium deserti]
MSQWLVSNLPSWLLLLGLIAVVAGGAVLLQRFVRNRFPNLKGDEHNDVIRFAFGVVGFVFAFFIGFVVSAMWGQINDADGRARIEGAAGVQLARDLAVFDDPDRGRIRQSLLEYEHAAVAEWTEAASGRSFPEADDALARLYSTYGQVQARTDAQKTLLAASFTNLNSLSQARTERVLQARTDVGPPWSLWAVIVLTSGLLLACAIIYDVEKAATHYTMVGILGVLVAANLFLVLELSHPFVGEIGTSVEPLRQVIEVASHPRG